MLGQNHSVDRIAITLLVTGVVLASAGVGTLGLAGATPQAETTQATESGLEYGTNRLAFPIPNATVHADSSVMVLAFPINNATFAYGVPGSVPAVASFSQDMDPYALGQDMDSY